MTTIYKPVEYKDKTDTPENLGLPDVSYGFYPEIGKKNSSMPKFPIKVLVNPITLGVALTLWLLLATATNAHYSKVGFHPLLPHAIALWILGSVMMGRSFRKLAIVLTICYFLTFQPVMTPVLFVLMAISFARRYIINGFRSTRFEPANTVDSYRNVWGIAGAHVAENKDFGIAGKKGAEGEAILGKALEPLLDKYPFIRVFHGVQFTPGVNGADVDHIVLIGNHVIMVDSKNWMVTDYVWTSHGAYRNGMPFEGGEVKIANAKKIWTKYLRSTKAEITADIVMVAKESENRHYTVKDELNDPTYHLVNLEAFLGKVEWLAKNTQPVVNRYLVTAISDTLQ